MDPTRTYPDAPCGLSDLVEPGRAWSLRDGLLLIRRLSVLVRDLHQSGYIHRAIDPDHVTVLASLRPRLSEPPLYRRLGGEYADPEYCPPEFIGADVMEVPRSIAAASACLAAHGRAIRPERIDVYQLGTLLCRLLSGESTLRYLYARRPGLGCRARQDRSLTGRWGMIPERASPSATSSLRRWTDSSARAIRRGTLRHCRPRRIA